jgi:hypothetical protein
MDVQRGHPGRGRQESCSEQGREQTPHRPSVCNGGLEGQTNEPTGNRPASVRRESTSS